MQVKSYFLQILTLSSSTTKKGIAKQTEKFKKGQLVVFLTFVVFFLRKAWCANS